MSLSCYQADGSSKSTCPSAVGAKYCAKITLDALNNVNTNEIYSVDGQKVYEYANQPIDIESFFDNKDDSEILYHISLNPPRLPRDPDLLEWYKALILHIHHRLL